MRQNVHRAQIIRFSEQEIKEWKKFGQEIFSKRIIFTANHHVHSRVFFLLNTYNFSHSFLLPCRLP